jgi:proteasome lid subunit RPN8/RPN11
LKIQLHVLAGIIGHARDAAPLECCGLLAGKDELIDEYICTDNIKASEVAYQVNPVEHIAAIKSLRARGRVIVGAYHSHPRTAAVPSATDLAEAHDADLLYVIVSLCDDRPDVRAYRLQDGTFVEVPVVAAVD